MKKCNIHFEEDCRICAFYDGPAVPILLAVWIVPGIIALVLNLFVFGG